MAVKVMWARAVREVKTSAPQPSDVLAPLATPTALRPATSSRADKPKRRRSSVYDADGNEVFITLVCLKCHKTRPLAQFGLRKMADGAIRNQPWCKGCRAESAAKSPRKLARGPVETGDPSGSGESPPHTDAQPAPENLAAQIAAALHAGRR